MGHLRGLGFHLLLGSLFWIASAQQAFAYLDPGLGSMLLQVLLGGTAGLLVIGKLYWHRVKALFGRAEPSDMESSEPQP